MVQEQVCNPKGEYIGQGEAYCEEIGIIRYTVNMEIDFGDPQQLTVTITSKDRPFPFPENFKLILAKKEGFYLRRDMEINGKIVGQAECNLRPSQDIQDIQELCTHKFSNMELDFDGSLYLFNLGFMRTGTIKYEGKIWKISENYQIISNVGEG
ncbi:hypothetical protein [Crocosphaera chwakensis]|uniref:Uncharacterized protein n=1 Tax=Crocosphaera chwakensis CCY0110 TaxID=391612 RepID=A3IL98_9CHRO|nr:hypothetical protein [Crocosphaera chwakensis]EAZ92967.1 hypothetical protein CY0110_22762 [Crocosphaera chwakensis CCY0110]